MTFDYLYTAQATGQIDIEDIGNVCLCAVSTLAYQEYILIIQTVMGRSQIIEYGPNYIDIDLKPNFANCSFYECEFSMSKLKRTIDSFLNNPKRSVAQVEVIDFKTAKDKIKNFVGYLYDSEGQD